MALCPSRFGARLGPPPLSLREKGDDRRHDVDPLGYQIDHSQRSRHFFLRPLDLLAQVVEIGGLLGDVEPRELDAMKNDLVGLFGEPVAQGEDLRHLGDFFLRRRRCREDPGVDALLDPQKRVDDGHAQALPYCAWEAARIAARSSMRSCTWESFAFRVSLGFASLRAPLASVACATLSLARTSL